MIDAFLRLLDKIIELVKQRQQTAKELLSNTVEPLFSEMAQVVDDYLALFLETVEILEHGTDEDLAKAIKKVTERRQQLLTIRIKVREMAAALAERYTNQKLGEFADQILCFFHSSQIHPYRSKSTPSKDLLVELYDFLEHPDLERATLKTNITQVLRNFETNWAKVTRAYCRVKLDLTP